MVKVEVGKDNLKAVRNGDKLILDVEVVKVNKKTARVILKNTNREVSWADREVSMCLESGEIKGVNHYYSYKVYDKEDEVFKKILLDLENKKYAFKVLNHLKKITGKNAKVSELVEIGKKLNIDRS